MATTKHVFTDRREAEAFAAEAKANNTFVRWSERQTRVSNRVSPAAAQFRNRYVFTVTTREA